MKKIKCPHCQNDDDGLMEQISEDKSVPLYYCIVCGKLFEVTDDEPDRESKASGEDTSEKIFRPEHD